MLIECILGNVDNAGSPPGADIDWIDLTWSQCVGRAVRGTTRGVRPVRVLLPIGSPPLRHGDILRSDDEVVIAVNALPTTVLVASIEDSMVAAQVALELGNLHVPVEIGAAEILALPDGPTEAVFRNYGVRATTELRRFQPEPCSTKSIPVRGPAFEIRRG